MFEKIRIIFAILFFAALLIVSGSTQKDVLKQKDPSTLNFLAAGYCPDVPTADGSPPLTMLRVLREQWEEHAREKHAAKVPGFERPWQIRFLEMPNLGPAGGSWALTRLMGGMAPEFMWSQATPEYAQRAPHWYIDLTPYLDRPNPYVEGNERWMDIFYPDALERWRASADRMLYSVPIDQVEIAIFYNKRIFEESGISEEELPPKDWYEFIDLQKRIKQAGHVPFLMTGADGGMRLGWIANILNDMLYAGIYDEMNVVDTEGVRTSSIDSQEIVRALMKGIVRVDDDRYWETWRIIKEWSEYWQPGFLGASSNIFFLQGRAAMTIDGSWFVKTLDDRERRDFDYGVFFIPSLSPRTTSFSVGQSARGVGGATAIQYSITKESALRKEAVEACVDFLMYITAPHNLGRMVAEGRSFLPAIRGAELADNLKFMLPVLEAGGVRYRGIESLNARFTDEWFATMQDFLQGRLDRQEVVRRMRTAADLAVAESLALYQDRWLWETAPDGSNTWEIVPGQDMIRVNSTTASND
jgi:raffinose/stachyose/melibiose transport system substrate-binding protein